MTENAARVIDQLQRMTVSAGHAAYGPEGWAVLPGHEDQAADYVEQIVNRSMTARAALVAG